MLRINIEQQSAKLDLQTRAATLKLHTTEPRLEINSAAAVVDISQPRGRLEIDQYPCRASYGLKNMADQTRDIVRKARQTVLEAIAKTAADGDRMAHIETKENVIVNLAKEAALDAPLEVGLVRKAPPVIHYYRQRPEFAVTPARLDIQFQRGTLDMQVTPGEVEGAMAQYQSIRMWTTGTRDFSA